LRLTYQSAKVIFLSKSFSSIHSKSDRRFNQNQFSIFNFFVKRRLLKNIKNRINSGDWLILNEKDFSPMMAIVDKGVFESKFYSGTILSGYSFVTVNDRRGTIKEEATALKYLILSIIIERLV
jgi:hypothetical protein